MANATLVQLGKNSFVTFTDKPNFYHLTYARTGLTVDVEKAKIAHYLTTMTHAFPAMDKRVVLPDGRDFQFMEDEYVEVPPPSFEPGEQEYLMKQ